MHPNDLAKVREAAKDGTRYRCVADGVQHDRPNLYFN